jgi:hypothetical protein
VEISQSLLTDEWLNKWWYIHIIENDSSIKMKYWYITAWMNLENSVLIEGSQSPKTMYCMDPFTFHRNRNLVGGAGGWGKKGMGNDS